MAVRDKRERRRVMGRKGKLQTKTTKNHIQHNHNNSKQITQSHRSTQKKQIQENADMAGYPEKNIKSKVHKYWVVQEKSI